MNNTLSQRLFSVVFQQSNSLFNIGPRYMMKLLLAYVNSQQIKIISMKNLMIPAIALLMFMASCDPVRYDAEGMCIKLSYIYDAQNGNDMAKIDSLQKEYDAEMEKMKTKYPAGSDDAKRFDAIFNECLEVHKADEICKQLKQIYDAQNGNDMAKIDSLQKEYDAEMEKMKTKYPAGSDDAKRFDAIVNRCFEEYMQADFRVDAKKFCDLLKKSFEVSKSGDAAKMAEFTKKNDVEMNELGTKYAKDTPVGKKFNELIRPCIEECVKAMNEN